MPCADGYSKIGGSPFFDTCSGVRTAPNGQCAGSAPDCPAVEVTAFAGNAQANELRDTCPVECAGRIGKLDTQVQEMGRTA